MDTKPTEASWSEIAAYLSGVLPDDLRADFERRTTEDAALRATVDRLREAWRVSAPAITDEGMDAARIRLWDQIRRDESRRAVGRAKLTARGLVGRWRRGVGNVPGGSFTRRAVPMAAVLAGLLILAGGGHWRRTQESAVVQPSREFVTRAGERATVELNDGTHVMLGPSTRLGVDFHAAERRLTLRGTAYFSVTSRKAEPFIVTAGRAQVRVLGTAFGVRYYTGEPSVIVAVRSGRVMIDDTTRHDAEAAPLIAAANDLARVESSRVTVQRGEHAVNAVLAWTEGRLVFDNAPLQVVRTELSRWYDIDLRVADPALDTLPISGGFSNQSVDELPAALSFVLPVTVTRSGRVMTISAR